jgi:periplasmic copper chaperone A
MRQVCVLTLLGVSLLAACGVQDRSPDDVAGRPVIEVRDAFIVQPPQGRDIAGGGLVISVEGGPVTLIDATTPIADTVELHTMSMEDGMMRMRKVESFPVTPESPLVLERGGNHLMLFGVEPVEAGDRVDVILTFTDNSGTEMQVVTEADIVLPGG